MSGRVEDFELERSPAQHVAFLQELVDFDRSRSLDAEPCGLHRQVPIQRQVALVHQDLRAGSLLEFLDAAHVTSTKSGSAPTGPSGRRACTRMPRQMRACWTGPRWLGNGRAGEDSR